MLVIQSHRLMIDLQPVPREDRVDREHFQQNYLVPRQPVVLTSLARSWPALHQWTPAFLEANYGEELVQVHDASFFTPGKGYMGSLRKMRFSDFLQSVLHKSADLRLFAYSLPVELRKDVPPPEIADGFSERLTFLFFGCKGSVTRIHFDLDMPHLLHTAIYGRKRVVLFGPEQSVNLYRHPFTVNSSVNVDAPDYERFPRLAYAKGLEVILEPGETLFIPAGWWHHIYYEEGGYAVTLRFWNERLLERLQGWFNMLAAYPFDRLMNRIAPKSWANWKEHKAQGY